MVFSSDDNYYLGGDGERSDRIATYGASSSFRRSKPESYRDYRSPRSQNRNTSNNSRAATKKSSLYGDEERLSVYRDAVRKTRALPDLSEQTLDFFGLSIDDRRDTRETSRRHQDSQRIPRHVTFDDMQDGLSTRSTITESVATRPQTQRRSSRSHHHDELSINKEYLEESSDEQESDHSSRKSIDHYMDESFSDEEGDSDSSSELSSMTEPVKQDVSYSYSVEGGLDKGDFVMYEPLPSPQRQRSKGQTINASKAKLQDLKRSLRQHPHRGGSISQRVERLTGGSKPQSPTTTSKYDFGKHQSNGYSESMPSSSTPVRGGADDSRALGRGAIADRTRDWNEARASVSTDTRTQYQSAQTSSSKAREFSPLEQRPRSGEKVVTRVRVETDSVMERNSQTKRPSLDETDEDLIENDIFRQSLEYLTGQCSPSNHYHDTLSSPPHTNQLVTENSAEESNPSNHAKKATEKELNSIHDILTTHSVGDETKSQKKARRLASLNKMFFRRKGHKNDGKTGTNDVQQPGSLERIKTNSNLGFHDSSMKRLVADPSSDKSEESSVFSGLKSTTRVFCKIGEGRGIHSNDNGRRRSSREKEESVRSNSHLDVVVPTKARPPTGDNELERLSQEESLLLQAWKDKKAERIAAAKRMSKEITADEEGGSSRIPNVLPLPRSEKKGAVEPPKAIQRMNSDFSNSLSTRNQSDEAVEQTLSVYMLNGDGTRSVVAVPKDSLPMSDSGSQVTAITSNKKALGPVASISTSFDSSSLSGFRSEMRQESNQLGRNDDSSMHNVTGKVSPRSKGDESDRSRGTPRSMNSTSRRSFSRQPSSPSRRSPYRSYHRSPRSDRNSTGLSQSMQSRSLWSYGGTGDDTDSSFEIDCSGEDIFRRAYY